MRVIGEGDIYLPSSCSSAEQSFHEVFYLSPEGCILEEERQKMEIDLSPDDMSQLMEIDEHLFIYSKAIPVTWLIQESW